MTVNNKYKIIFSSLDKQIDIPIELKWDFYGRDDSIEEFQEDAVNDIIGRPGDFEIMRFAHDDYGYSKNTSINYKFYFFDSQNVSITSSTSTDWKNSYIEEGFSSTEIYYYTKPFTKSFFKLDFYDTNNDVTQKNYFTIIIPVQQGEYENVSISSLLPNVRIRKPSFILDYVGDKEGFFIYWLRKRDIIDISTFYMSAKFFDAKQGVYVKMMNVPQSSLNDLYLFDGNKKFYYKVILDYNKKTYRIYDIESGLRIGQGVPINWYEYINP